MGRRLLFRVVIVFIVLLNSCRSKEDDKDALRSRTPVGLKSEGEILKGGVLYSASKLPMTSLLKKQGFTQLQIDSLLESHSQDFVYEVRFRSLREDDLLSSKYTNQSYQDAVSYIASPISKDFFLVCGVKDTIKSSGVLFERHYQMAPFKKVLVYFQGVPLGDDPLLLYEDNLFGNGMVEFNSKRSINL